MKTTLYADLKRRADNCRENAKNCVTEWSKKFWKEEAERLEYKIDSLTAGEAASVLEL